MRGVFLGLLCLLGIHVHSQDTAQDSLIASFGEIPLKMSSEEIQAYAKNTTPLKASLAELLEEYLLEEEYLIPLGKFSKGKYVTLLYIQYNKRNGNYISINAKSFHSKSFELYLSSHHLCDIGAGNDGYFERNGEDEILFVQYMKNANGEMEETRQRYAFGKHLEFIYEP